MNQSYLTLLNQARQNHSQGDPEKALVLLKKLLEISRNDNYIQATAYFEIGKIYTALNKNDLAIKFFKKAISVYPEVLIQEFEWFQGLKTKNKKHIYNELEKTQSEFKDYLIAQTKDSEDKRQQYIHESTAKSGQRFPGSDSGASTAWNTQGLSEYDPDTAKFAGFWKRVVATIVDGFLIMFVNLILMVILVYGFGFTLAVFMAPVTEDEAFMAKFIGGVLGYFVWYFISILFLWLYYAIMESSRCQGTLGKILLGIFVTDQYGARIGIGKATGRYFLKILMYSVPVLGVIDCLMVAFSEKKQAWHDMPVGCLVLSKQ